MSELLWTSPDISLSDLPSLGKAALFFFADFPLILSPLSCRPAVSFLRSCPGQQRNKLRFCSNLQASISWGLQQSFAETNSSRWQPVQASESVSLRVNCFFDPFLVPWRGINGDVRPLGSCSHPSWNHYNIMTEQGQVKSLAAPITLLQEQPVWEKNRMQEQIKCI